MFRHSSVLILSLFSLSAFAAIIPGPERAVSGVTYAPPAGEQRSGAVASDGSDFLSIWTDATSPRQGVYAAKVGSRGEVNVFSQRLVHSGAAREVSLCYAGDGYLATWTDDTLRGVMSARLNRDGSLNAGPRLIVPADQQGEFVTPSGTYPRALACSNNGAMLVFRKGTSPMYAILDSSGNVSKAGKPLPITDGEPIVTISDGTSYFVAARSSATSSVGIVRVSGNGDLTDSAPVQVMSNFTPLQIGMAFAGGRLSLAAVAIDKLKRAFVNPQTLAVTNLPDAAQGGQEVNVVAFGTSADAFVMSYNLTKLDILRVPLRDNETSAQIFTALHSEALGSNVGVATNGHDALAVWKDFRRGSTTSVTDGDIFAGILDTGAGSGAPFPVAITAIWQGPVSIASSGSESLMIWHERIGDAGKTTLMSVRIAPNGALLDSPPRQLASSVVQASLPVVVWDGTSYVAAWTESAQSNQSASTSVVVQRIGKDGALSGAAVRYDGAFSPALASNGASTLFGFSYPDGRGMNVVLMQPSSTGAITPLNVYGYNMSIGSAGSDYLVTWTEGAETCQVVCFPDRRDISGVRVNGNGTVLDGTPIAIATGAKDQAFPHVASNGNDYVIVYDYWVDGIWTLAAKRVTHAGQLVDSLPNQDGVILANDVAPSSAVVRDDSSYVVAYDLGSGTAATAIRLIRIGDNAAAIEESSAIGAGTRSVPSFPSLAKGSGGPVDVAYSRYATESSYGGTMRAFVRLMPDAAAPPGRVRLVRH